MAKLNIERQYNQKVDASFATLFLGLWVTRPALAYSVVYVIRCFAVAATSVFLSEHTELQLIALTVPTVAMLAIVIGLQHHMWRERIILL